MNVTTITMPQYEANEKLRQYKRALSRRMGRETAARVRQQYEEAAAGYAALSQGTPLIDLEQVFNEVYDNGEHDHLMRPKLAVARADQFEVKFRWRDRSTFIEFCTGARPFDPQSMTESQYKQFNVHQRHGTVDRSMGFETRDMQGWALVPTVPADVLPQRCNLRKHFVFWEVEEWANSSHRATPDRDPYLLKLIGGTLYAVVAEWDLTDLERAIMRRAVDRR